jgi:hypothetical protein
MFMHALKRQLLAAALLALSTSCSSDPGLIDCRAYIDHQISCELLPSDSSLRDTNIKICNNWERTYKVEVMEALDACIDSECAELPACAQAANQLCQADVTPTIESLCERVSECQWEGLTTMELCREELVANTGLYSCLRPDVLEDYVQCVRNISCGPDSEDEWYGCGFKHVQPG